MVIYRKTVLFLFPSLFLLIVIFIGADNYALLTEKRSVAFTYIQSFRQGQVGYGDQSAPGNDINFTNLEPGDILLGGWPGCAYGYFSHAGLYLGNNQVLESYIHTGVTVNDIFHYHDYSQACILRVKTSPAVKQQAIAYALQQQGKMFYPVSFKNDERYWNCTKIIWKAYQEQGINLDPGNDLWTPPDALGNSPMVEIIASKGGK